MNHQEQTGSIVGPPLRPSREKLPPESQDSRREVHAEGENVYVRPLVAGIVNADLRVGDTTAEPALGVGLVLDLATAPPRPCKDYSKCVRYNGTIKGPIRRRAKDNELNSRPVAPVLSASFSYSRRPILTDRTMKRNESRDRERVRNETSSHVGQFPKKNFPGVFVNQLIFTQ